MRTRTSRGVLAAILIVLTVAIAACGDDGGADNASDDLVTSTTTATESTIPGDPDTSLPTGEEICTKVSSDLVGTTLDLEVTTATSSDPIADVPPSCTYAFIDSDGNPATVTVSALRPLDMGGRVGSAGYDTYVEANRTFAQAAGYGEAALKIGREAVRFTSPTAYAAISETGKHVVLVSVPTDDADVAQVDALLAAVAGAIG